MAPGDAETQKEIIAKRKHLQEKHKGHSYVSRVRTINHTTKSYFARSSDRIPQRFHECYYWCFATFGLSLVYRCFLYFHIGLIDYKIKKVDLVTFNEGQPGTTFTNTDATDPAAQQSSESQIPHNGSSGVSDTPAFDACWEYEPPMSPLPSYDLQVEQDPHLPISLQPYIPPPTPPPGYTTEG